MADEVLARDAQPLHRVPDPFPLTLVGMLAMLGPQAINFGISGGGGEAYLLPNIGARGTCHRHWLMLISVVLESALVYECIKYSMHTGRSFFAATAGLGPKGFWPWYGAGSTILVAGWPAWLGGAASAAQRFTGVSPQMLLPGSTLPPLIIWLAGSVAYLINQGIACIQIIRINNKQLHPEFHVGKSNMVLLPLATLT